MSKFRQFLINEEVGLADLGPRIEKAFQSHWFGNQQDGAITSMGDSGSIPSPTTGSTEHTMGLPATDMTIPSVTRSGRITTLVMNKNPIYVCLSDGTEAHFTYDEYKRIEGDPGLGKTMTIIFQRHPEDLTNMYSKIDKAIVTG